MIARKITHRTENRILLEFGFDNDKNKLIRKIGNARWSKTYKNWHIPNSEEARGQLMQIFPEAKLNEQPTEALQTNNKPVITKKQLPVHPVVGKLALSYIGSSNKTALYRLIESLQLKAYSEHTLVTYRNEFAQLLYLLKEKKVDDLAPEQLRNYFLYCRNTLKLSENTIHSRMNAIKYYYEQVLHREKMFFDIPRPKRPLLLPNVLAISEVEKLFAQLENLKHKAMLFLAYSAGLRVSEVVALRVADIHSARMVINIKGAKGKKDRMIRLSDGILDLLRKYYRHYKPQNWLFEGQYAGEAYSVRSLQQIFSRAKVQAKIAHSVSFHSLRHSYATHLHELGTDIKLIQELLGHNDIKTTLRYTHVSNRTLENIKSPFDQLNILR